MNNPVFSSNLDANYPITREKVMIDDRMESR